MPVTLVSDQTEGSNNRMPNPNTTAGTQRAGILQAEPNGLPEITALKKLQMTEDPPAIQNLAHARVGHRSELLLQARGRWLRGVSLQHVNCVLPLARFVAGPEKELVHGNVRREKV